MPGNRRLFEHSLKRATSLYAEKTWDKALAMYQAALAEFPDDTNVLEKVADLYERLGQLDAAAQSYMTGANVRSRQGNQDAAIDYWERATRLNNDNLEAHKNLAFAYSSQGKVKQAVREHLALAHIYQQQNRMPEAVQSCQAAYALDPTNPDVLTALELLRVTSGRAPAGEADETAQGTAAESETRGSPIDITREKAMSDLAESIFEEALVSTQAAPQLGKPEIDALISQALDHQTQGNIEAAIDTYRRIVAAGVHMPAVHFNLGLLYQENVRLDEAIEQFKQSVDHEEYHLGSLFALGELYRAKGLVDQALVYFIEALKIIDLQTVGREQADDLIQVYESLAESFAAKGEAQQAGSFVNTLVDFLSSKGWEDKVVQARRRLDSLTEEGAPAMSLAEILSVRDSEAILQSMSLMQELAKRGKYYSALEEAYIAVQRAPDYLPLHLRIADVVWKTGQTDLAVAKYLIVANTLYARGDARQAMAIYQRVLRLAPMDTTIRSKLIELLIAYGQIDRAIEQYLALADTYYQLASIDKAREKYVEALKLAPRGSTGRLWPNQILHKMGDMDTQRGDWRRAIQTYEQLRQIDPQDEKARLMLIELYYKVQPQRAIAEIDEMIKTYRASGKLRKIVPIIEDQIRLHPRDMALQARAAQACIESGLKNEGIKHLNDLGEMLLNAGQTKQAMTTIKAIIALNPPNVEEYKILLARIGS